MTKDEVMTLCGDKNPVLCTDGMLGMLLIYPTGDNDLCGVQIHGEKEHRWIASADLSAGAGGALRQTGEPTEPLASSQTDLAQMLLALDWSDRGGC